jgi:hypothetical protein
MQKPMVRSIHKRTVEMMNAQFQISAPVKKDGSHLDGWGEEKLLLEKAQRAEGASYRKALNPVIAVTKEVADGEKNSDRSYEKNKGWNKPDRAGENIISKLHHACCLAPSIAFR